jgi:SAM-dependent methyltransferase
MSAIQRLRHRYHLLRARLRNAGSRIRPGERGYDRHVAEEIEHYTDTFDGDPRLIEPAPPVWEEVQRRARELIRAKTGDDLFGHLVRRLTARAGVRLLSLGSGPGGVELALAREAPAARIACMDLNAELLDRGRRQATGEGLAVEFEAADLNVVALPAGAFVVRLRAPCNRRLRTPPGPEGSNGSSSPCVPRIPRGLADSRWARKRPPCTRSSPENTGPRSSPN